MSRENAVNTYHGDIHSIENQHILAELVHREIIHCASGMVYELAQLPDLPPDLSDAVLKLCVNIPPEPTDEDEGEERDVYEHWIVTDWLGDMLAKRGETVGDLFDFTIWGRTCTGQAIKLDEVIADIAAELEILHGQAHEWKNV